MFSEYPNMAGPMKQTQEVINNQQVRQAGRYYHTGQFHVIQAVGDSICKATAANCVQMTDKAKNVGLHMCKLVCTH